MQPRRLTVPPLASLLIHSYFSYSLLPISIHSIDIDVYFASKIHVYKSIGGSERFESDEILIAPLSKLSQFIQSSDDKTDRVSPPFAYSFAVSSFSFVILILINVAHTLVKDISKFR